MLPMQARRKCTAVLSKYGKEILSLILLLFPAYAAASDPRGLFWPVMIGFIFLGLFLFAISSTLIFYWVDNSYHRSLLFGFTFGLFLGPIHAPNGVFIPNIASFFGSVDVKQLLYALMYACIYAAVSFALYWLFIRVKRN